MPETLGEKIRRLRLEKKMTLDGLAAAADSSKSYVWELENRTPPRPSADKLSKIAEALGVTLEYLASQGESGIVEEDAKDANFYRKYRQMDPVLKDKIRKMVDLWDDD